MGAIMASQRDGIVDEENGKVYDFGGATSWPSIEHDGLKQAEALMFEELSPADVAARTGKHLTHRNKPFTLRACTLTHHWRVLFRCRSMVFGASQ